MGLPAGSLSATVLQPLLTCSLPRKKKLSRTNERRNRRRLVEPKTLSYPKSSPTPLLTPQEPLTRDEALDRIISNLESSSSSSLDLSLLSSLLEISFRSRSLTVVSRLRRLIPAWLLRRNAALSAKLLRLYASLGLIDDAHRLFDQMPQRNKASAFVWNSLISGYAELGFFEDAMALYFQMEEEGVAPDRFTFPRVLKSCSGIGSVCIGHAIHRHVVRLGFGSDVFILNALVDMYAKCGDIQQARRVFDIIPQRDEVSWNSMLTGYLRHGLLIDALEVCREMIRCRFEPDSVTLSAMLSGFSSDTCYKFGCEIHGWAIRRGLDFDLSVGNSLIRMYSEHDQLHRARLVFESMPQKDLVSWNSIISAHRRDHRVLLIFQQMVDSGVLPDQVTFISLLAACANLRMVEDGKRLFSEMEEVYMIRPRMEHYGCLANMLGRAGLVEEAHEFVSKQMPFDGGPTVWGALLFASSVHGNVEIGEIAAERLFELEPDNEHNFVLLMRIYSDAGKFEEVEKVRKLMKDRGLEPF
ncbi:pentatricopeptide repeat-containing protein At4g25270, chloroplastic [Typha latifolia]|uniref:pentatricopeptide repeat-containing protein At4g25270, chloroplastic n=1 Tax=Typha latifolia TaxID=4733 RepID=UPI003C2E7404